MSEVRGKTRELDELTADWAMLRRAFADAFRRTDATKIDKRVVDYGPGMEERHCSICQFFDAPNACRKVAGDIQGSAWCELFEHDPSRHDDAAFQEEDHPRDEDGKFTSGGGGASRTMRETKVEGGKRVTAEGKPLPKHIASLRIPPAWSDVRYAENEDAHLLVTGKDVKGRRTAIYSASYSAAQAAAKYARVKELADEYETIWRQNENARKNPGTREAADCLALIMATGIRPGSTRDTGADQQAFGATTLQGRHVRVRAGGKVVLEFTGKKGVSLAIPVEDEKLAKMLLKRKEKAGPKGDLFGVGRNLLAKYASSLDGGSFNPKDFRTALGTATALKAVASGKPPTDEKSYKRAVLAVAKEVSAKLGNTPAVALQSYINPVVFAEWRTAAGV